MTRHQQRGLDGQEQDWQARVEQEQDWQARVEQEQDWQERVEQEQVEQEQGRAPTRVAEFDCPRTTFRAPP